MVLRKDEQSLTANGMAWGLGVSSKAWGSVWMEDLGRLMIIDEALCEHDKDGRG